MILVPNNTLQTLCLKSICIFPIKYDLSVSALSVPHLKIWSIILIFNYPDTFQNLWKILCALFSVINSMTSFFKGVDEDFYGK